MRDITSKHHAPSGLPPAARAGVTHVTMAARYAAPRSMLRHLSALTLAFAVMLGATPLAFSEEPLRVEYAVVQLHPLTFDATLTGTIEPRNSVDLGFRQSGRIIEVLVKAGDHVEAGQVLAKADPTQQEQALLAAQAKSASAQAALEQARQAHSRAEAMLGAGVGTKAALDAADQSLSAAEGGIALARTELDQAQRAVSDTILRAPSDAIVTARDGEVGQIVGAAQTVATLATANGLDAVFQTPDLPMLDRALRARVSLQAIDLKIPDMTATVREISPLVDPHSGAVTMRAEIHQLPIEAGLLGAAVRGTVHLPAGSGMAVPWTSLTAEGEGPALWRIEADMSVSLVPIAISRFTTDGVIVASGVTPGDRIVAGGSQLLYPGRKVIAAREVQ